MNCIVAVLDHDNWRGLADVIVWVNPAARRLTWVPRDLWSPLLGDRINTAVALGGSQLLRDALLDLRFPCDSVICLRRGATEAILRDATITVPVKEMMAFWVASMPSRDIKHGRKLMAFVPPREILSGDRLHWWMGARLHVNGAASDLHRIERQQILLRAVLQAKLDLGIGLEDPDRFEIFGEDPIPTLRGIDADWEMTTFAGCRPAVISGKPVLERVDHLGSI